ncbi:MAG: MFS transporter [Bacillota bacterium]
MSLIKQAKAQLTPLNLSIADGLFATISNNFVGFMTPFLLGFGASNTHISAMASLQSLAGNVLQIPFAHLTERLGRRKFLCIIAGILSRLLWVLLFFVPVLWHGQTAIYAFIAIMVAQSICSALNAPAWTSFMGDIVPKEIRGRFFATRNIIMNIGSLFAVTIAGRMIEAGGFPNGYRRGILISLLFGLVSFVFFLMIPEPKFQPVQQTSVSQRWTNRARRTPLRQQLQTLSNSQFGRFVLLTTLMSLGAGMSGPFFSVYAMQNLGATTKHLGYYAAGATACVILSQGIWGYLSDRKGARLVMQLSAFGVTLSPLIWIFSTSPWHPIIGEGVGGLAWSGWGLASFNLLLELTPEDRRPTFVAAHSFVNGLAAFVAPLIGGVITEKFGIPAVFMVTICFRLAVGLGFRQMRAHSESQVSEESLAPSP